MNNTQLLAIIFWCFIVLITRCFSLHFNSPETEKEIFFFLRIDLTLSTARLVGRSLVWSAIRSFFCVFLPCWIFPSFTISAQLHVGFGRVYFYTENQKMWVLHVLLLCHISRPFPPNLTKLEVAFWIVYTHKHNSMPKHISAHPILFRSRRFRRSFCHFAILPLPRFLFYEVLW